MQQEIRISLNDGASIKSAIHQLALLKLWVRSKTEELNKELAAYGASVASVGFSTAPKEDGETVDVTYEKDGERWVIRASGGAAFFIEFGAGVYYNGSEPYPEERPAGVVRIGEYGKGHGKKSGWFYYDSDGHKVYTHGTPASMPMYRTKKALERKLPAIAKKVFGDGI